METVKIEGIDTKNLRPDMADHREKVCRAFCKAYLTTSKDDLDYANALFNGIVRVPLVGGMLFAHTVKSATAILAKAAIATHKDIVTKKISVP